jgi:catechol 2,3-dioxygenase-like lactoylglutathione lyase family enzyme
MRRMLSNARIEARIPTQDLARARRWYAEKLGLEPIEERDGGLRTRGVVFDEYDGAVNGIMDIAGNYPSKGRGERAAWFRDSEGNMLGIAEVVR